MLRIITLLPFLFGIANSSLARAHENNLAPIAVDFFDAVASAWNTEKQQFALPLIQKDFYWTRA